MGPIERRESQFPLIKGAKRQNSASWTPNTSARSKSPIDGKLPSIHERASPSLKYRTTYPQGAVERRPIKKEEEDLTFLPNIPNHLHTHFEPIKQEKDWNSLILDFSIEAQAEFIADLEEQKRVVNEFSRHCKKIKAQYLAKEGDLQDSANIALVEMITDQRAQHDKIRIYFSQIHKFCEKRIKKLSLEVVRQRVEIAILGRLLEDLTSSKFPVITFFNPSPFSSFSKRFEVLRERVSHITEKGLVKTHEVKELPKSNHRESLNILEYKVKVLMKEIQVTNVVLKEEAELLRQTRLPAQLYIWQMKQLDEMIKSTKDIKYQVKQELNAYLDDSKEDIPHSGEESPIRVTLFGHLEGQNHLITMMQEMEICLKSRAARFEIDPETTTSLPDVHSLSFVGRMETLKEKIIEHNKKSNDSPSSSSAQESQSLFNGKNAIASEIKQEIERLSELMNIYKNDIVNLKTSVEDTCGCFKSIGVDFLTRVAWR